MKLKETKGSVFSKPNVKVLLACALVLILLFVVKYMNREYEYVSNTIDDTSEPTLYEDTADLADLVLRQINRVYTDDRLSIYTLKNRQIPTLAYVYKAPLTETERTDKFYLHLFLRDDSLLQAKMKRPFLNLDFVPDSYPTESFKIGEQEYIAFKRPLRSTLFTDKVVPFHKIESINTGRFQGKERSKVITDLPITFTASVNAEETVFQNLTLTISKKSYEKIRQKRDSAITKGVLLTSDDDFVKATISTKDIESTPAKIRLKGDWIDHLEHHKKWSYRIILDGEETLFGMRKLSVQHPMSRNYAWEWLFNKVVKQHDIIGLRYGFANVKVQIKDDPTAINMGIMAIEESFDKILIENNRRREGLILALDESLLWQDRERAIALKLTNESWSPQLHSFRNANIKVFNENKVLQDPKLTKQLEIAKDLIDGLRTQKLNISQVFDVDKLTTYVALANLFGGDHGLIWHNLRFYYNPITNKLEPVAFDTNSGQKLTEIIHHPLAGSDEIYHDALVKKLQWVSSDQFLSELLGESDDEIEGIVDYLQEEYDFSFDSSILYNNSNYIKKYLDPAVLISANLMNHSDTEIEVEVKNLASFPVVINELHHSDGKLLGQSQAKHVLDTAQVSRIRYKLDDYFDNAFVSKKNKKGGFNFPKDVAKLRVQHSLIGSKKNEVVAVSAFGRNEHIDSSAVQYKRQFAQNLQDFEFLRVNYKTNIIRIIPGSYTIDKPLKIPEGFQVLVSRNVSIDIKNDAFFYSNSPLICKGTKEEPIRFYSSDGTGGGLFISNTSSESKIDHCIFTNLSNPTTDIWELTGAVNFHEADVQITNAVFEKNRCEDGLNIIRSNFKIDNSVFKDTKSDAFDGDFVTGTISNSRFENTGNDGIDVSGSKVILNKITIVNPSDKAISAGEASTMLGGSIFISGGEIGIVSKDLSTVHFASVSVKDTKLAFSAFQKKTEFGTGTIDVTNLELANNQTNFLIEKGSKMTVDGIAKETVSNKVIDQMYGNEYGKSSK